MVKTRTEIFSRVVGYLRNVDAFNDSKFAEFKDRKYFDKAFNEDKQTVLK